MKFINPILKKMREKPQLELYVFLMEYFKGEKTKIYNWIYKVKIVRCVNCKKEISIKNVYSHIKTKKHIDNERNNKVIKEL